ncbi:MAG: PAS domain S-box protein [Ignavibacteriaceae bacterium]
MKNNSVIENTALKILILEDSFLDMELIVIQLSEAGYQLDVTHTANEVQFIEALEKNRYDIVLSDFNLNGFDAFGALEISLKFYPEVPFICFSGCIGEEKAIALLKQGAVDYVLKDRPDRLPFAIKNALEEAEEKAAGNLALRKLKESEIRFRQVAETAEEWIWEFDTNGMYTYASPVIESFLGYTPDEVVGKIYFYDFFSADKKEEMKKAAFEIFSEKKVFRHFENINLHKNGNPVWFSTSGSPVFDDDGNLSGYRGVDEDITERKKAEEKLRLLNRAIESSSVSVIITDADGNIDYVNPYFTQLTGYSIQEVKGKNPRLLNSGSQVKEFYKELWDTILSGKDWSGEFRNRKKNGEFYWENAVISPILNGNGKISNFVAIKDDITEKKKIITELLVAKEKAEESDKLKTAFINNISHEIRTPLNSILGIGQIMAESELSEEERKSFFEHLEISSNRLMNTVADYVDMAMLFSKTMNIHKKDFAPEPLLAAVSDKSQKLCLAKNLNLQVSIPPGSSGLTLNCDPELIRKILEKLIDNAIKFSNEGCITLGYLIKGEYIEFFVKDTGPGIADDKQDLIFEMFRQADVSMTRGYEGSGLGLTIAKEIVTLLGGDINVTSSYGKGSTFRFTVPADIPGNDVSSEGSVTTRIKHRENSLILIAEDNELNYAFLSLLFKAAGRNHIRAANGKEAVDICRQNPDISLVLMDIKMPVMNGDEATRLIRTFRPDLPIIATTAYAQTGDEDRFLEAGCTDYIPKPIKKEILLALISKYT